MDIKGYVSKLIEDGVSQNQIAKESGISTAALSGWLRGNYAGDAEAVGEKLETWAASRKRREEQVGMLTTVSWIETETAKKIQPVLAYAQYAGDIAVVYGGAGVGKTRALRNYADTNPNVFLSMMSPANHGVSACLEEVAVSCGLKTIPQSALRISNMICGRVEGSHGLVIADEAQHLSTAALEQLRIVQEKTGIGLVLCGNETVYGRLTGGTRQAQFAQLFSRIGKRLRLNKPLKKDVASIAGAFGVSGREEVDMLYQISQKPGALRGVCKTLRLASMFSAGEGAAISEKHIAAAWKDLAGEE